MKLYPFLSTLLICFATLVSCSENEDDPLPTPDDYLKYITYNREYYGLKNDVKTAERTSYDQATWNSADSTLSKNAPTSKNIYLFDENGALITMNVYRVLSQSNGDGQYTYTFSLSSELSYVYDDKYRITEEQRKSYVTNGGGSFSIDKYTYTYDEANKQATMIRYYGDSDALEPVEKRIYALDDNNRLDDRYIAYFLPQETKSSTTESLTSKVEYIVNKDSKGNPVMLYQKYANISFNYTYISGYYDQVITYYDGTISDQSVHDDAYEVAESLYVAKTLSFYGLTGNVKSYSVKNYDDAVWNDSISAIVEGDVYSESVYKYDTNGVCIEDKSLGRSTYLENNVWKYGPLRVRENHEREYDSKYRITSLYDEYYSYRKGSDETPYSVSRSKYVITYDDQNAKAIVLKYKVDDNGIATNPDSKTVYKLKADGTINGASSETYSLKATAVDDNFKDSPSSVSEIIKNKDANGNIIESYKINKQYDAKGNIKGTTISSYQKFEITYY